LYNFILFFKSFLWPKHTVYNSCDFQIFMYFVINVQFFFIRYHIS
jgi:hypothetical protein